MKRNNAIPRNHFKKTAKIFKTWFHQKPQADIRRKLREEKATTSFPMPTEKLRPIVRCPTIRYNTKVRLGRGFNPEECEAAGIDYNYARTIGIAVDMRRKARNTESFNSNVERLKEYLSKITIYNSKQEALESGATQHKGVIMPIVRKTPVVESIKVSDIASYN